MPYLMGALTLTYWKVADLQYPELALWTLQAHAELTKKSNRSLTKSNDSICAAPLVLAFAFESKQFLIVLQPQIVPHYIFH